MDAKLKARIARKVQGSVLQHGRSVTARVAQLDDAPYDGATYARRNSSWVAVETGESNASIVASAQFTGAGNSIVSATIDMYTTFYTDNNYGWVGEEA